MFLFKSLISSFFNISLVILVSNILPERNDYSLIPQVSYNIEGSSPNRILKIEYKDFPCVYSQGYDPLVDSLLIEKFNAQLWFYETSNILEVHYGTIICNNPNAFIQNSGALIGLMNAYSYS